MRKLYVLTLAIACLTKVQAQLYANFTTNVGNFTCELFYKETPRTVGNFVTLAEGTRQWLDSRTGIVSTTKPPQPFYANMVFHRIINNPDFKIAQVGSKNGQGTDGPGYTFPDEMRESVPLSYKFDQPYLLAMANAGFNTNGSQIFLTGNAIPGLDGKHTVFGKVTQGTDVVDLILAQITGNNVIPPSQTITLQSVTIQRVGRDAERYRPTSQRLPVVSVPKFKVAPAPAPAVNTNRYAFTQPQRSEFRCHASIKADLSEWIRVEPRWLGAPYMLRSYDLQYGSTPITGFRPALIRYDYRDVLSPGSFAGQMITMENADGVYVFRLPRTGPAGFTFTGPGVADSVTGVTTFPAPVTGTITGVEVYTEPYRGVLRFALSNQQVVRMTMAFDSKVKTTIRGRCTSEVAATALSNFIQPGGDKGYSMVPIR